MKPLRSGDRFPVSPKSPRERLVDVLIFLAWTAGFVVVGAALWGLTVGM